MWPRYWSNTVLSQTAPSMEFLFVSSFIIENYFIINFVFVVYSYFIFADVISISLRLIVLIY